MLRLKYKLHFYDRLHVFENLYNDQAIRLNILQNGRTCVLSEVTNIFFKLKIVFTAVFK